MRLKGSSYNAWSPRLPIGEVSRSNAPNPLTGLENCWCYLRDIYSPRFVEQLLLWDLSPFFDADAKIFRTL